MLTKPAYNEEYRIFDFSPQLTAGESLAAPISVAMFQQPANTDVTVQMISDVAICNQTSIRYKLMGGTPGTTYLRRFRVVTSNGQKLEDTAPLKVI